MISLKTTVAAVLLVLAGGCACTAQPLYDEHITPADALPASYVPQLLHKRVALVINQTSVVGDSSLLDMLLARGIRVVKLFVPEHGFRGLEDAGAHIDNSIDSATGVPIVSLYGKHKKPTPADLEDADVVVYDLQDVGARFYTYISTLQYVMEACAENGRQIMVLDRPNPNGFYVDGPVMDKASQSFVGLQAIPIVYGMTCGEYAGMLAGEQWFNSASSLRLTVIPCQGYTHSKKYKLPVPPSPNLRTMAAVYAYPSLCLFEGTVVSVGRGTDMPFQQYGAPELKEAYSYSFTPQSGPGAKTPPHEGKTCYGEVVGRDARMALHSTGGKLQLGYLLGAYRAYPAKEKFFNPFFTSLAGSGLEGSIRAGKTEQDIRSGWKPGLDAFKAIRRKYLLYPDFK